MAFKPVRNLVSRFLTTFTARLTPKPATDAAASSFAVQFLTSSCGLSSQSALLASRKVRLKEKNLRKPESVIKFLKSHGFRDTQISTLIQKWPQVLHCKVEGNLKPKFDFFIRHGFVGNLLSELMLSRPFIFKRALHSHIEFSFEFLKWLFDSDEKVVEAVSRRPWLLVHDFKACQPSIGFLLKEGVPLERMRKLLFLNVRAAMEKRDSLVFAMNALKDLGLQPKEPMFVHGLGVMLFMNPSIWKERVEMMKSMGWSEEETVFAFLRFPYFISASEGKLRRAMDFYMNTMKLGRERIINNPVWLSLSIDKRVRPRFNLLRVLQSRMLMLENKNIGAWLKMSEKKFLENYVIKFENKIPGLLQIYLEWKTI